MITTIEAKYAKEHDITFIFKTVSDETGLIYSEEITGWYWGKPDDTSTAFYDGSLCAEYTD